MSTGTTTTTPHTEEKEVDDRSPGEYLRQTAGTATEKIEHESIERVKDAEKAAREAEEQAALPYKWTQTLHAVSVDVKFDVAGRLKGKDCVVVIERKKLKVSLKTGAEPVIEGALPFDVKVEESAWTLGTSGASDEVEGMTDRVSENNTVSVELHKIEDRWWPHVVTSAPKIDTTKIVPENSSLSDLDGETRAMVEKMMVCFFKESLYRG